MHFIYFFNPVNCGDPASPMDGSIDAYLNTTEGAEIFFRCDPGFVPSTRMTATCMSDGWTPDPADLTCTCKYLLKCQPHEFLGILAFFMSGT